MDGVPVQVQAEAKLGCAINLDRLCTTVFLNCELGRGQKSSLVVHMRRANSILRVRADGELSIAGHCSVEDARNAMKKVARRCKKVGFPVKFKGFKVISVKWSQAYRPAFAVDVLELQRHPEAEIRQNASSMGLRVLLPCGNSAASAGDAANSEGAAGPRADGSKPAEGARGLAGVAEGRADAQWGVVAEVSADGRTRFHGAKSVEELKQALGVLMAILEDYKLPGFEDGSPGGLGQSLAERDRGAFRQQAGPGRFFGGRRRGPQLSREALELEEPVPGGNVVNVEAAEFAALVVPIAGRP